MTKKADRTEQLGIRITTNYKGLKKKLDKLAKADDRTLSNYVLQVLKMHVDKIKD